LLAGLVGPYAAGARSGVRLGSRFARCANASMNVHKGALLEEIDAARLDASESSSFLNDNPTVQYVDCVFVDLCGNVRGKRIARGELEDLFARGLSVPGSIYFLDARGEVAGAKLDDSMGTAWPVAGTITQVSWSQRPHGQVLMTLRDAAGTPYFGEPRNVLKRVIGRFADLGVEPAARVRMEYYLADQERAKSGLLQPAGVLGPAAAAEIESGIAEAAATQGLPALSFVAGHSPGQVAIEFNTAVDALQAADNSVFLRQVVRAVARLHKLDAVFMARPFADLAASGMRFQLGLRRGEVSVFATTEGGDMSRSAVGGLQTVMADSIALFAPSVNSFRRFTGNHAVPRNKRWGYLNKTANISIVQGNDDAPRIDVAIAGADANPYLALAAMLAGVHYGISQGLDAGAPADGDVSGFVDPTLPMAIDAALLALENGPVLREYFGPAYVDLYCAAKRTELERFRSFIPPHEYDWYL
jgi:glutamine synthetase